MARETIGHVNCPLCNGTADVRADKKGTLYLLCGGANWQKGCGKLAPSMGPGQEWIRSHMRPVNEAPPEPVRKEEKPLTENPAPAAAPAVEIQPPPPAKKRPWYDQEVVG